MSTVRAGATRGLVEFVAARGGSGERALAAAGLAPSDLWDDERLIPVGRVARLYDAAARELGDDSFGLHFGEAREPASLGVLTYAILHAPTVGAALRNLDRFSRFHFQGGRMRFERRGTRAAITFELDMGDRELARHYTEATAVLGSRVLRQICGGAWRAEAIRFGHRAPRDLTEHERILGGPLSFEEAQPLETIFPASDLEREVPGADPALLGVVRQHLETHLARGASDDWLDAVRRAIAHALSSGSPTAPSLSRQLGMSLRTFQRRLEARGLAFTRLVAEVRQELAESYLRQPELNLGEVAFLLGYSDLSSFHRAFRRWHGTTPLETRRRLVS